MKTLPSPGDKILHGNTSALFEVKSVNLGGDIKMKCIDKGVNQFVKVGDNRTISIGELTCLMPPYLFV